MTTVSRRIRKSRDYVIKRPGGFAVALAFVLLTFLVGSVVFLRALPSVGTGSASYPGVEIITPVESKVCIGGEIHFFVTVIVRQDNLPDQGEIAEGWCRPGLTGTCVGIQPDNLRDGAKRMPLIKEKNISVIASRDIPLWLTEGKWEFHHTIQTKDDSVEGYSVEPINVVKCEESIPTSP